MKYSSRLVILAVAAIAMVGAGCAKKKVAAQAPPPPAPPAAAAERSQPAPQQARASTPAPAPAPAVQPRRMPNAETRAHIDTLLSRIEDAYFDYDKHTLRPDGIKALEVDSSELRDILKDYPDYKLTIEGHCDERGSAEYNLGLGDRRASSARDLLVQLGVPAARLHTISYGKERPQCTDATEACYQLNRRAHISAGQ